MSKRRLPAALLAALVLGSTVPAAGALGAPAPVATTVEGTLELEVSEQADAKGRFIKATYEHFVRDAQGRRTRVTFAGDRPEGVEPGAKVRVKGHRTAGADSADGDATVLADVGTTVLEAAPSTAGVTATAAGAATTAAAPVTKRLAVILVNFASNPVQPYTREYADGVIFSSTSSVAAFYAEDSYGTLALEGDVSGWFTISYDTSRCDTVAIQTKADAAATAAGVVVSDYDHVSYVFPHLAACSFAGRAQLPGTRSWINTISTTSPKIHDWVVAHELGHNFGANHANSYSCVTNGVRVSISATSADCASTEYGDPHTVMGAWNPIARYPHNHAWHRVQMGLMDPADRRDVTVSGIYTLGSTAFTESAPKSLKVPRGTATNRPYFELEFRQPGVLFDGFSSTAPVANGASIRLVADDSVRTQSYLLDMTPSTTTFADAALAPGKTFVDPRSGIAFTALGTVTDAAGHPVLRVKVFFPNTPPPAAPTAFTATSSDDGLTATLSWQPAATVVGVASYRIYRDDVLVATVDGSAATWADTDRVPGTTYAYRIEAIDWVDLVGAPASTSLLMWIPTLGSTTAEFAGQAGGTRTGTEADLTTETLTRSTTIEFGLHFSAPVTRLTTASLALTGTATGCTITGLTGSGAEYMVSVTGCSDGTVSASIAEGTVRDNLGYLAPAAGATSDVVRIDRTPAVVKAPAAQLREASKLSGTSMPARISWSGTDPGSGIAWYEVARSVDGGAWTTVFPVTTTTSFDVSLAPGHTYRYRVRSRDLAGNVSPWIEGALLKPGLTQNSSTAITWRGTWYAASRTEYSGGTARYTKSSTASATYTFTGRGIALVTTKAPARGKVKVYIDGVFIRTVDLYRSSVSYRELAFTQMFASSGTHTIKLVGMGTAGRPRVDLDAFAVIR